MFGIPSRLALLALACLPTLALAAPGDGKDKDEQDRGGEITLGVGRGPLYEGSAESTTFPVLGLNAYLNTRAGRFGLDMGTLSWTPLATETYSISLLLNHDGGRKENGSGLLRPKSSKHRLEGMGDLGSTWESGLSGTYMVGPLNLEMKVLSAMGNKGHRGVHGDVSASHTWMLHGEDLILTGSTSLSWASNKYMDAYFGVTSEQARRSRFKAYDPKAGFTSAKVSSLLAYKLTHDISIGALVSYSRMVGDAADSPITERKGNWMMITGLRYSF